MKVGSVRARIGPYLFPLCVFGALAFVCNQKSVIKRCAASLRCGSLLSKRLNYASAAVCVPL